MKLDHFTNENIIEIKFGTCGFPACSTNRHHAFKK